MSDTKLNEAISITTSPERLTELVDISIELARAVATNPSAPSDLLQKLSKYDDLETRRNVALNPNTSTDILFKLAQHFPEEFLNNPILGLLLLENPNLLQTIPADTFLELLKVGNVPQMFIEWALQAPSNYKLTSSSTYNYKNWCLAIASNPNNTKELLLELYQQFPKTNIAQAALLHVNLNGEINSYWNEAAFIEIRTCGYILRNKTEEQLLQKLGIIPKHLRPYSEAYRYAVSLYRHSISTYKYVDLLNRIPLLSPIIHYIIDYLNNKNQIFDLSTPIEALLFFLSIPYLLIKSAIKFSFKHKKILVILLLLKLSIIACTSINFSSLKFLVILMFIIILLFMGVTGFLFGVILIIFINTASVGIALLSYPVRKLYDLTKDFNQETFKQKHLFRYSSNIFRQDLEAAKNPNTSPTRLFELASSRWLEVREAVAVNPNADA